MKKYLTVWMLLMGMYTFAQSPNQVIGTPMTHYVLDKFYSGKVYMRSGEVADRLLNYHALTREMIFEDRGQYLAIANAKEVDSVILAGRKFIPGDKKFYEWVAGTNIRLYADFVCTIEEEGAAAGYGTNSNTTASNALTTLIGSGSVYAMKLPDDYKINSKVVYYLYKDNEYHKINNAQQLSKLFPAKKLLINEWVKNNPTDFSKRDDLARLIMQLDIQAGNN